MKKKKVAFAVVFGLIVLLAPRLYILTVAFGEYYNTDVICTGRDPTPPKGLGNHFPVPLYEVKPFTVITNKGYMFPGDEYEVLGEGDWYGMVTLLWAGKDGAAFVVTYEVEDPLQGYSRQNCRWDTPVGNYR